MSDPELHDRPAAGRLRSASDASDRSQPSGAAAANIPPERRGLALPGDRGSRSRASEKQRPSFWRRIALGRRGARREEEQREASAAAPSEPPASAPPNDSLLRSGSVPAPVSREMSRVRSEESPAATQAAAIESIEKRVVEPMLQALVSVESKLERSHIELVGRSDQVEQRLTQLWDIEEQLGTLGELQESLLQVSEQQRRLESSIAAQNRTLRWLLGAVLASLALAAFVVAAVAR